MAAQGECDYEQARELFEEGLALAAEVEEKVNVVYCMEGLGRCDVPGRRIGFDWARCAFVPLSYTGSLRPPINPGGFSLAHQSPEAPSKGPAPRERET